MMSDNRLLLKRFNMVTEMFLLWSKSQSSRMKLSLLFTCSKIQLQYKPDMDDTDSGHDT